jgi:hypothetical protein
VSGQYGIYDSGRGDANYSPIWRHNYDIVPRDVVANTLEAEDECKGSGYQVVQTETFAN